MVVPNEIRKGNGCRRLSVMLFGGVLLLILTIDLSILCAYFTVMSLFMLTNPGELEDWRINAMGCHILAALLYFASLAGVVLCFLGLIAKKTPIKCLLIVLSILGMAVLPASLYIGVPKGLLLSRLIYYFAELSSLLFAATLAAFHFLDLMQSGSSEDSKERKRDRFVLVAIVASREALSHWEPRVDI